jgi:spore maturation protein CgeB
MDKNIMIKVLYCPLNFGDQVMTGVYDAFRQNDCQLEVFDYFDYYNNNRNVRQIRRMFVQKAIEFQPDLLHMQIQHTTILDGDSVNEIRNALPNCKIVNWTGDVRNYIPVTYLNIAKYAHFNLISSTGQLDMFRSNGVPNVGYWQIGYNPQLHFPEKQLRSSFDFDVVFLGNVNPKENYPGHNERMTTMYTLRRTFGNRFGLFGNHWPKDLGCLGAVELPSACPQAYHRSFCSLSVSHYNQLDHYFSDRLLMCLASGRPTVCWKFPKVHSYFVDRCDLLMAEGPDDVVQKVKYLLDHPDEANYIGASGAAKVFAEHTYFSRISELLDMVGLKGK